MEMDPGAPAGVCKQSPCAFATRGATGCCRQPAVLAEDHRRPRLLHRPVDVERALDRTAVLSAGTGLADVSRHRRYRGGCPVRRPVRAGGDLPRSAEAPVVYRSFPRGHGRLLPDGSDTVSYTHLRAHET